MRVVIAPDKFKGSLSAEAAAQAMARGVARASARAEVDVAPMADGGEGTVEALVAATRGELHSARVANPLGVPVEARFGLLGDGRTAVLEMAQASGLVLLAPHERDPNRASTRGAGELLRAVLDRNVSHIIMGIGGSATNDGGAGLAQALGYRLLDAAGQELGPGGAPLSDLAQIDASGRDRRLDHVSIEVACDVDNPLCGPNGATAVFGAQKFDPDRPMTGLDRDRLDAGLARLARIIERDLGKHVADLPGSGAAGGLGAGLVAFAGGRLRPGIAIVSAMVKLEERLAAADLCLTGEGSLDGSSLGGKTAVGVARLARDRGVPCLVLAGSVALDLQAAQDEGVTAAFSICHRPLTLAQAIEQAAPLLEHATEQAVRAWMAGRNLP